METKSVLGMFNGGCMSVVEKKPFHENIVKRLEAIIVAVITNRMMTDHEAGAAETLLGTLMDSKMPAEVAHQIAEKRAGTAQMFADAGYAHLAEFTAVVIADLRSREADKKPEPHAVETLPPGITAESRRAQTRDICGN